jgi:hypothetical protein
MTIGGQMRNKPGPGGLPQVNINIFTKEIFVSLAIAILVFIAGYFIVLKKSVK